MNEETKNQQRNCLYAQKVEEEKNEANRHSKAHTGRQKDDEE